MSSIEAPWPGIPPKFAGVEIESSLDGGPQSGVGGYHRRWRRSDETLLQRLNIDKPNFIS